MTYSDEDFERDLESCIESEGLWRDEDKIDGTWPDERIIADRNRLKSEVARLEDELAQLEYGAGV